jgi:hypothetical protein
VRAARVGDVSEARITLPGSGSRFTSARRGANGIAEIREVVSTLRLDRIGVGILAAQDEKLMGQIGEPPGSHALTTPISHSTRRRIGSASNSVV